MTRHERLYLLYGLSVLAALCIGIVACYHVMNGGFTAERIIYDAKYDAAQTSIAGLKGELEGLQVELADSRVTFQAWTGLASYYSTKHHGKPRSDGRPFNMYAHTAASMTLPFGTDVLVLDLESQRWTITRIQDRGPHPRLGREIDLSLAGARELGMVERGVVPVMMIRLSDGD